MYWTFFFRLWCDDKIIIVVFVCGRLCDSNTFIFLIPIFSLATFLVGMPGLIGRGLWRHVV